MKVFPALLFGVVASAPLAACNGGPDLQDPSTSTGGSSSSGGASSSTGGSTSGSMAGSTTTGGRMEGCPDGWQKCTPANLCDNGCSPDGGLCEDQLSANPTQTGVPCDAGSVCEGSLCFTGSGPQVPNHNGGVLSHPNIVLMTYADDPNQQALQKWAVWVSDGGYLATTVGQYGVGNATLQFVSLSDSPPDQNAIPQYLQTHFDTDSTMPPFAEENIYLIVFPTTWVDTSSFCKSMGGYHTFYQDNDGNLPIYAVVAACSNELMGDIEVSASHEIVEASTDPYLSSWTFNGISSPWAYIGGELGDMCESNTNHYLSSDQQYAGQYIWSNSAALAGQVPCQPWPADQVYVDVIAPQTMVSALPGTSVDVPVTGWASGPTGIWAVATEDAFFGVDFHTNPSMSSPTISPGQQDMVQLTVPASGVGAPALGGLVGAAWVLTAASSESFFGSAVVGVMVSCQTSADCSNPAYGCAIDDGGVGSCAYNYCDGAAGPFSACSAEGNDDGVCLPYDTSSGSVEVCLQAGSLAAGASGCQEARVVGAGANSYCGPTAICEGTNSPACFSLCRGVNGSCANEEVCVPLAQNYGFCVKQCSSSDPCPANQTCYNEGSFDICYPN